MRRQAKSNAQLTAEVNRLRRRLAFLESYLIQLSRWVLHDDITPGAPVIPPWPPPAAAPEDWSSGYDQP